MLYVQLNCNWPDNEKVIDAGIDGAGLHAIVLCLAKRLEDDGWVHRRVLQRYGAPDALIERLAELHLLEVDGDRVRPHGWHRRNPSQAAIEATRASKRHAGRRGNHTRWNHPGAFEDCPTCQVIADSDHSGSQNGSTAIAPDPVPTSKSDSSEVGTAITSRRADGYEFVGQVPA